jgi:hypothetical protein
MLRVRVTTLELKKPCPKHKHGLYQPKLRREVQTKRKKNLGKISGLLAE